MAATKYRPIRDAQRNGTVPKTVIRDAVRKLAELRRTDPTKYKAKIKSGSGKHVYLVVRHT